MAFILEALSQMETTTFLIFFATLLLGFYMSMTRSRLRGLPSGPYPFPIFGNLPQIILGQRKHGLMTRVFEDYRQQYGDMFRLNMGARPMVVIMGRHLVKEALVTKGQSFINRPSIYLTEKFSHGLGVIFPNGRPWKEMRRFSLSSMRDFGLGKKSLEGRVHEEAQIVMEALEKYDGPFFPKRLFLNAISNIICGIVFGNRFEYTDAEFQSLLDILDFLSQNAGIELPENFFPFLAYIPGISKVQTIVRNNDKMRKFIQAKIAAHRMTYDPDNLRDFLDLYLQIEKDGSDNDVFTEENMFRTIMDLFSAGSETTATTLTWLTLYMCVYPDVQARCQEEIDTVVGAGRMVSLEDRANLHFTMAVIQELQRVVNVVPTALPRETVEAVEIGGYLLPKGTMVMPHIGSVHWDEEVWPEPKRFNPDRWLDADGKLRKMEAFLPFSSGPRSCLGEPLARMELFLFFGNIFQRFNVRFPDGSGSPDLDGYQLGLIHHPSDYMVTLSRR